MARTDNDTWDLATSVGATATGVAVGRALASRVTHPLIDDPFAEPLVRAVGVDFFTRLAAGELDLADIDDGPWGMRQMRDMMAVRTKYFDEFFLAATAAGIRQAVILASGLDARGYRLSWPAGTVVYEIDQPAVIEFKTGALAVLGAAPTADLRTVPIDLRQDWPAALAAAGFDASRPTAWSAEGLLPFLPPDAQDRLLDNVTELSAAGSRLATEDLADSSRVMSMMQDQMTATVERWRQHGFNVSMTDLWYPCERNGVVDYLGARGWDLTQTKLADLYAANGLPVPAGDDDVMASRSEERRVGKECRSRWSPY